jgi:ribosomal protein S18 acetylase RimI-like enzyme
MEITKITQKALNDIIKIHIEAFPGFFLTFLGPGFLKEFYKSFLYDDQGIGFVAVEDNRILGAIVGPFRPAGYFKRLLLRKWYVFCFASIGAVLRKPKVIKRLFRAVFYRGEAPQGKDRALLSSIAVSPSAQGKGIGKALVMKWLDAVSARGGKGAFLTTDAENNNVVNSFYHNLGWKLDSTYETSEGRKMNRYVYDFEESEI